MKLKVKIKRVYLFLSVLLLIFIGINNFLSFGKYVILALIFIFAIFYSIMKRRKSGDYRIFY